MFANPAVRAAGYAMMAVAIVVLSLSTGNKFYIHLAQTLCYTTVAVIGLNVLLGLTGQMSLGQAAFYAIGAYGSALLSARLGLPLFISMPAGVLLAGAAGFLVGLGALRTRGTYLAMATLAFGFIVEIAAQRWTDLTGGTMGIIGIPSLDFGSRKMGETYFLWVAAGVYLLVQILSDYVFASRFYRILLAVKENESAARTAGFNVPVWRVVVFGMSAATAGIAGVFFTHQSAFINSDAFTLTLTLTLLIAAVIGGLGRSYGPLLGTAIALAIGEFIASLVDLSLLVYGCILLGVLLLFPEGAIGLGARLGHLLTKRKSTHGKTVDAVAASTARLSTSRKPRGNGPVLQVADLSKHYQGVKAVEDVTIDVMPGTIHAVIGPNGAGKSTLINCISGIYRPTKGRVYLDGQDITDLGAHRRARLGLSRSFQNLQLVPSLSVIENVMLGVAPAHGAVADFIHWMTSRAYEAEERARALALLAQFNLDAFADASPDDLPYGHRKLVEMARVLAEQPLVMLLDEPIAGLNDVEAREIAATVRRIRDAGTTILLVEHNMEFVMQLSDRVTVLDYGTRIAEGSPAEVQRDPTVIAAYLGTPADAPETKSAAP